MGFKLVKLELEMTASNRGLKKKSKYLFSNVLKNNLQLLFIQCQFRWFCEREISTNWDDRGDDGLQTKVFFISGCNSNRITGILFNLSEKKSVVKDFWQQTKFRPFDQTKLRLLYWTFFTSCYLVLSAKFKDHGHTFIEITAILCHLNENSLEW